METKKLVDLWEGKVFKKGGQYYVVVKRMETKAKVVNLVKESLSEMELWSDVEPVKFALKRRLTEI